MRRAILAICLSVILPASGVFPAGAATIAIINADGPGEGFNDPTPVAPVGGNFGTTLGEQRLIVFQEAADIWGALLPSAVTVRVYAQFNALSCDSMSAVLGSAGPVTVIRDFTGAEMAGTWYHIALANKLSGVDLSTGDDISATFNSSIDFNDDCLVGTNWYYGLDGNEGMDMELLPVVLHELSHGLGFSTLVGSNGTEFLGYPDVYETFILDNTLGLTWDQMTKTQRAASAENTDNVVWNGPAVTLASPRFLGGVPTMFVNSPPTLPATIRVGTAEFGPELTETGVTGNLVLVDDGTGVTSDACSPLINGAAVSGNIALIDRGTCTFVSKAQAAQAAGAIAVVIVDNVAAADPILLGGTDPTMMIPVVSVTLADGNLIKAELATGVNVTLAADAGNLAGADANGRVKLYAPDPYEGGSSISHWDVTASPSLLMEPFITLGLSREVDLTLGLFTDIGWVDDCLEVVCPADTTVASNSLLSLAFRATNCAFDDNLTVTVSDSRGWCTPIDDVFAVIAGGTLHVPVSVSVPDSCATPADVLTFEVRTSGGFTQTCTTSVTASCGPVLELDPLLVTLGAVAPGDTVCAPVHVINTGGDTLHVGSITGCDGYLVDLSAFDPSIAPGDTSGFEVCFTPVSGFLDSCVVTVDSDGGAGTVTVRAGTVTAVGGPGGNGPAFLLASIRPTPFSSAAEVRFHLPAEDRVQVDVFDLRGRLVQSILSAESRPAGEQSVRWDGRDERGLRVAPGIYFVRVATASHGSQVMRAVRLDR